MKLSPFITFLLFSILHNNGVEAQNYDTSHVKPSKEIRRENKKYIDSLLKNTNYSQSDTAQSKKNETADCIFIFFEDKNGNTVLSYDVGYNTAEVNIYDADSKKIVDLDLSGSGKKIINKSIADLITNNKYFYNLYLNGKFISTNEVKIIPYSPPTQKNGRERNLN